MQLIFRLPFLLLEGLLRQGAEVLSGIVGLLRGRDEDAMVAATPSAGPAPTGPPTTAPAPRFTADGPPPPTAEEAIQRRFEREAAAAEAAEPTSAVPEPPEPRLRAVEEADHVDTEATVVESFGDPGEVGASLQVDEPWEGYATQPASAIVARLRDADAATRAVVRLYEQTHKKRATVLRATG